MNKKDLWEVKDDGKLKTSEIVAEMRKLFKVCVYDEQNLDGDFPKPEKETIRYFRKNTEADPELSSKSADDLKGDGIKGINLRERLLLEISYFKETGKHLDEINATLCSGSRYPDGYVPRAYWYPGDGGVHVNASHPGDAYGFLRSRIAVSLNPETLILCEDKEHLEAVEKLTKIEELLKRCWTCKEPASNQLEE